MKRGSLSGHIQVRPVRVGLAINADSVPEFRKAVELATAVWGGIANPIIPVHNDDDALRLAEEFDVDVIFAVGESSLISGLTQQPGFAWEQGLSGGPFDFSHPRRGDHLLGAELILRTLGRKTSGTELLESHQWADSHPLDLLNMAVFGLHEPGSSLDSAFKSRATDMVLRDTDPVPYASDALSRILLTRAEMFFASSLLATGVVVIDPHNLDQVVAFWNQRAIGNDVIPWPLGQEGLVQDAVGEWIRKHNEMGWPAWAGDAVLHVWTEGDSIPRELESVLSSIPSDVARVRASLHHLRVFNDDMPPVVTTPFGRWFNASHEANDFQVEAAMPSIDILPRRFWHDRIGFVAVIVEPSMEWDFAPGTGVGAPDLRFLSPAIRQFRNPLEPFIRPFQRGIVLAAEITSDVVNLPITSSFKLIKAIFERVNVSVTLGHAGRHTGRLIEILGGAYGDSAANQPAVRAVLRKALASPFGKPAPALIEAAKKAQGDWPNHLSYRDPKLSYAEQTLRWLTARKALKAILKTLCLSCGADLSISPDDLRAELRCDFCGDTRPLALNVVARKADWLLATSPTLPRERLAETYPVMATVSVMSSLLGPGRHLPPYILGLELDSDKFKCEIDFAFILQNVGQPILILGEAKSGDVFDAKDFANLRLAQAAAREAGIDCYLMFSTLRDQLTPDEIAELRKLCEEGLDQLFVPRGRPQYPVVPFVFTGRPLSVHSWQDDHPSRIQKPGFSLIELAIKTCEQEIGLSSYKAEVKDGKLQYAVGWK